MRATLENNSSARGIDFSALCPGPRPGDQPAQTLDLTPLPAPGGDNFLRTLPAAGGISSLNSVFRDRFRFADSDGQNNEGRY